MSEKSKIETLVFHVKEYIEESFNLIILNIYEKVSRAVSGITAVLIFASVGALILVFLSIALSIWIGRQLNEPFAGFLIVAVFYLLIAIFIYAKRDKWVRLPVTDAFLKNLTYEEED